MTDEMKDKTEEVFEEVKDEEQNPFETFVEKQRLAAEEFTKAIEELFPAGFREHTRNAGKAFVDSFKVLLDSAKEDIEDIIRRNKDTETTEEEASSTKVKVDIE